MPSPPHRRVRASIRIIGGHRPPSMPGCRFLLLPSRLYPQHCSRGRGPPAQPASPRVFVRVFDGHITPALEALKIFSTGFIVDIEKTADHSAAQTASASRTTSAGCDRIGVLHTGGVASGTDDPRPGLRDGSGSLVHRFEVLPGQSAKSTAKSANREKSSKLAFEPRRDWFSVGL
jgi:hypothetical protein